MKAHRPKLILLLSLLVSLFPASVAFADSNGNFEFYGTVESLPSTSG